MKIKNGFMMREVAGKYVVVPVGEGASTFKGMIQMNGLGAFLWNQLKEGQTKETLVEAVLEHYDASPAQAETDVQTFLTQLLNAGILEK
mgnify:CR=1 FL=1